MWKANRDKLRDRDKKDPNWLDRLKKGTDSPKHQMGQSGPRGHEPAEAEKST
ncbi:hypothetical protein KI387_023827, partial [Taxus chinensis]